VFQAKTVRGQSCAGTRRRILLNTQKLWTLPINSYHGDTSYQMQDRILFLAFLGRGLGLWVGLVSSKGFRSLSVDLVRGVGAFSDCVVLR
jgi:hypothetical protein